MQYPAPLVVNQAEMRARVNAWLREYDGIDDLGVPNPIRGLSVLLREWRGLPFDISDLARVTWASPFKQHLNDHPFWVDAIDHALTSEGVHEIKLGLVEAIRARVTGGLAQERLMGRVVIEAGVIIEELMGRVSIDIPVVTERLMGRVVGPYATPIATERLIGKVEGVYTQPHAQERLMGRVDGPFGVPTEEELIGRVGSILGAFDPPAAEELMGRVPGPFEAVQQAEELIGRVGSPLGAFDKPHGSEQLIARVDNMGQGFEVARSSYGLVGRIPIAFETLIGVVQGSFSSFQRQIRSMTFRRDTNLAPANNRFDILADVVVGQGPTATLQWGHNFDHNEYVGNITATDPDFELRFETSPSVRGAFVVPSSTGDISVTVRIRRQIVAGTIAGFAYSSRERIGIFVSFSNFEDGLIQELAPLPLPTLRAVFIVGAAGATTYDLFIPAGSVAYSLYRSREISGDPVGIIYPGVAYRVIITHFGQTTAYREVFALNSMFVDGLVLQGGTDPPTPMMFTYTVAHSSDPTLFPNHYRVTVTGFGGDPGEDYYIRTWARSRGATVYQFAGNFASTFANSHIRNGESIDRVFNVEDFDSIIVTSTDSQADGTTIALPNPV